MSKTPFNQNKANLVRQPCKKDCEKRSPGCAASCPAWAEYVMARDKEYAMRMEIKLINDAVQDGYRRLARR